MRISDWSSDVCSSDLLGLSPIAISIGPLDIRWYSLAYIAGIIAGWWYLLRLLAQSDAPMNRQQADDLVLYATLGVILGGRLGYVIRSEEHTSELQSLMRISYAVFWLKKKNQSNKSTLRMIHDVYNNPENQIYN